MSKMKPWTKEDFEKFRTDVCADKHFDECNACARGEEKILKCFDDLTYEPYPQMNEGLKRGYFVHIKDEGTGEAVIATSSQEAKKLAWPKLCLDGEWIDLRARIVAGNGVVSDLPVGRVKDMELALRRGFFSAIDGKCEICGKEDQVVLYNDKIVCGNCEDQME